MGKLLDTLFFTSLTFLAMYVFLCLAGKDIQTACSIAIVSAICASVITHSILNRRPRLSIRRRRVHADKVVKNLIYQDAFSAHKKVTDYLKTRYDIHNETFENGCMRFQCGNHLDEYALFVIPKLKASPDDLIAAWRTHGKKRPITKLVIATPGKTDSDMQLQAFRMQSPRVVLIDKFALRKMALKCEKPEAPQWKTRSLRPIEALKGFISRKRGGKYMLYALLLVIYYLLSGVFAYLIFGFVLTLIAVYSLFLKHSPDNPL